MSNFVKSVSSISVPALMVFLTVQTRGMYITFDNFVKNFVSKEYLESKDVHNVRKWLNLCSIKP